MRTSKLLAFAAFTLLQATLLRAGVYEYDWTGGSPGFSGAIFLDAPSLSLAPNGGTMDDVLPGSYVTTPAGTFSIIDTALMALHGPHPLIWDETQISRMDIFFDSPTPLERDGLALIGIPNAGFTPFGTTDGIMLYEVAPDGGLTTFFAEDDRTGHWAAAVPEPAVTPLLLLASAMMALRPRREPARKM